MNYFIADLHFGCKNEYDKKTLEDDDRIIKYWNAVVTQKDDVWILGDIGKEGSRKDNDYLVQKLALLKGKKHLIRGNHDKLTDARIRQQFVEICDYKKLQISEGGKSFKIILSHYPILMWEGQHDGAILFYGHLHNSNEENIYKTALLQLNEYFSAESTRGRTDCPQACAINVGIMTSKCKWQPRKISELL